MGLKIKFQSDDEALSGTRLILQYLQNENFVECTMKNNDAHLYSAIEYNENWHL